MFPSHLLRSFLRTLTSLVLAVSCLLVSTVSAAPQIESVRVGIDGWFKVGVNAGIEIELVGEQGEAVAPQIRVSDPDGHPTIQPMEEVTCDADGRGTITGTFRSGRLESPIQISLKNYGVSRTLTVGGDTGVTALRQDHQLWVLVGQQDAFVLAARKANALDTNKVAQVVKESLNDLPTVGWEAIDLIVLPADAKVSDSYSKLLETWVQRGGRLVVTFGDNVASFQSSPLKSWLPIVPTGQGEVRNLSGLNAVVPGSEQLRLLTTLPAAELDEEQGQVLASGLSGPLLMRSAFGRGQVTVLSVSLDKRPLSNWEEQSQADFAMILANLNRPWEASQEEQGDSALNPSGVSDLQTQLLNTLDSFDSVHRSNHWQVLGWIGLFIAIIGPLDYLLVHRLLRRPQFSWFSLPIWITVASTLAIQFGDAQNAHPLQGRQVSITDLDLGSNEVSAKAWLNYYSPGTKRYHVEVEPTATLEGSTKLQQTGWVERPEPGFRGMYRAGQGNNLAEYHYSQGREAIDDLPIQQWSSGSVRGDWLAEVDLSKLIQADLQEVGPERLSGKLTHQLPFEIKDWLIAYGNFAYFPRARDLAGFDFLPDQTRDVEDLQGKLFRAILTGLTQTSAVREKKEDTLVNRQTYNLQGNDTFEILRMATFHEVAGGSTYTTLTNQSLGSLELTQLLSLNRAVLWGRIESQIVNFKIDGETIPLELDESYIRIIIPVAKKERTTDAPPTPDLLKVK